MIGISLSSAKVIEGRIYFQQDSIQPLSAKLLLLDVKDSTFSTITNNDGAFRFDIPLQYESEIFSLYFIDSTYLFRNYTSTITFCSEKIKDLLILYVQSPSVFHQRKLTYIDRIHQHIHHTYLSKLDSMVERSDLPLTFWEDIFFEQEIALKLTPYIVDHLAMIPKGSMPLNYQTAIDAFWTGDIAKAKAQLSLREIEHNLRKFYQRFGRKVQYNALEQKEFNGIIEQYILLATFQLMELNFNEAEKLFTLAIYASPGGLKHVLLFARYLQMIQQPRRAASFLNQALEANLCKGIEYAHILVGLGDVYTQELAFDKAVDQYKEAEMINEDLLITLGENSSFSQAQSLSLAADSLQRKGFYLEAKDLIQKSIRLVEPLVDASPKIYNTFLAKLYAIQGNIHKEIPNQKEAQKSYERAIGLLREMIAYHPEIYLPYSVRWNQALAELYVEDQQYQQALEVVKSAQISVKKLLFRFPRMYMAAQSQNHFLMASIHSAQHEFYQAIENYDIALDQFRQLAMQHPEQYRRQLQELYLQIGKAYTAIHLQEEAQQALLSAHELIAYQGIETAPMLIRIQLALAELFLSENNYVEAGKTLEQVETVYLTYLNADSVRQFEANIHLLWGKYWLEKRDYVKAEGALTLAFSGIKKRTYIPSREYHLLEYEINTFLGRLYTHLHKRDIASSCFQRVEHYLDKVTPYQEKPFKVLQATLYLDQAALLIEHEISSEATALLDQADNILREYEHAKKNNPFLPGLRKEKARQAYLSGIKEWKDGFLGNAHRHLGQAYEMYISLTEQYQREYMLPLIHVMLSLGEVKLELEYYEEAILLLNNAEEYITLLGEEDSDAYREEYAWLYMAQGKYFVVYNFLKSRELFEKSIQMYEHLNAKTPEAYKYQLAKSYFESSIIYSIQGDWEAALLPLQKTRRMLTLGMNRDSTAFRSFAIMNLEQIIRGLIYLEQLDLAEEYIEVALSITPEAIPIQIQQANLLILKNKFEEAERIYTSLNGQLYFDRSALKLASDELYELEANEVKHKDFKKIRKLLIAQMNEL